MAEASNGATRAGLWLSIAISAAVLISMIGGMFFVAFETKANSDAIADQSRILRKNFETADAFESRLTKMEVGINEIEAKFCAEDTVRNLMHANDLRQLSLLWEKEFGTRYPTDNVFYPTICNRGK